MFSLIWWALPGRRLLKTLQLLLFIAIVVLVAFWWIFPWVVDYFKLSQNTVGALGTVTMMPL